MNQVAIAQQAPLTKAIIYCRVSDKKQLKKGDGLNSQETRCREFARMKGYEVVDVFRDEGVSGSMINRPGMLRMLAFLHEHKSETTHVVIIDDISRLARGIEAHYQLRSEISEAGGKMESPSVEFGEDSDSILVENLLAAVSQHQRQKNAEQVVNRMRARLMNGYWCFPAPVGYRYKKSKGGGKILVLDEPDATIVREALQRFADGRFESQIEVKEYWEKFPNFKLYRNGKVHIQRVRETLVRSVYAGYVESENWNVSLRKGQHEPLISFETHKKVLKRLDSTAKAPVKKAGMNLFLLRGFVSCGKCGRVMTGASSQGRSKKYPYYFCQNKNCSENKKSIRKEQIEKDFLYVLRRLRPDPKIFKLAKKLLEEAWNDREQHSKIMKGEYHKDIAQMDKRIEQLVERIADSADPKLTLAYENQIRKLQEERIVLEERAAKSYQKGRHFSDVYRTALTFLENPSEFWDLGDPEKRKMVLRLVFEEHLPYWRNGGYRTVKTTLPFKALEGSNDNKYGMVGLVANPLARLFVVLNVRAEI